MLLWEVLLDGERPSTLVGMRDLRDAGKVADSARRGCKAHLESHHRDERPLFAAVLDLLDQALQDDPRVRPTAASLVLRVRCIAQHE